jgi:hypothetical protein
MQYATKGEDGWFENRSSLESRMSLARSAAQRAGLKPRPYITRSELRDERAPRTLVDYVSGRIFTLR